jgi:hypothetical protein
MLSSSDAVALYQETGGEDFARLCRKSSYNLGPLQVDNQADRSVLGSQRVAADDLQIACLPRVATVLDLDPVATSNYLNERPCRVGKTLIWPA